MRTFLQRSAGGTFCMGSNVTFVPRKDSVEIVIKMQSSQYGVTSVFPSGKDELLILCNWGTYFDRLHKAPRPDIVLNGLRKKCPKFVGLAEGKSPYGVITLAEKESCSGIGKEVKAKWENNFVCTVAKPELIKVAFDLLNYNLSIHNEIYDNCPIEEWKKGLSEVYG